jgi:redox-sensitive bicupin YhaK (pirin superfamily)
MLWDHEIPRESLTDDDGRTVEVTVIAGELDGHSPPSPPPHSWAARSDSDVALWHVVLDEGASLTLPATAHDDTNRVLYLFEGAGLTIGDADGSGHIDASTGAVVDGRRVLTITASDGDAEVLVMQGRPIGEPVAQHGPFVMNTRAEIMQTFDDYQRTQFGGWPWDRHDPHHGPTRGRFARHADGRVEEPEPQPA